MVLYGPFRTHYLWTSLFQLLHKLFAIGKSLRKIVILTMSDSDTHTYILTATTTNIRQPKTVKFSIGEAKCSPSPALTLHAIRTIAEWALVSFLRHHKFGIRHEFNFLLCTGADFIEYFTDDLQMHSPIEPKCFCCQLFLLDIRVQSCLTPFHCRKVEIWSLDQNPHQTHSFLCCESKLNVNCTSSLEAFDFEMWTCRL